MRPSCLALAAAALFTLCAAAQPQSDATAQDAPEAASGHSEKPGWATTKFAVAVANPLAAQAGYEILKAGGSAIDAAVAVQMALALVEPQASGIGGGALLLHYNGKAVEAYDGRETAPAAVDERLFLRADGKPLSFGEAVVGGRAVGVPGAVRMLEMAHAQHGRLPWARLFQPAIALAESGFVVSPRLNSQLKNDAHLKKDAVAAAYFYTPEGKPRDVGDTLRNPELAVVLRRIAAEGAKALHEGSIARAIVDKVRSHPTNPGTMALADLAGYQPKRREPICYDRKAGGRDYRICGFPPPSAGPIAIGQILGILDHAFADAIPLEKGLPSANWLHLYTEASRLAFADLQQYVGDPDFVDAPAGSWTSLLDGAYLAERARLIGPQSMRMATAGTPRAVKSSYAPSPQQAEHGTSHVSVIDERGNAVALTTTIESQFGARQMVSASGGAGGFLLNNELTDFSFVPADAQGKPIANRVQPGKRPRSAMSPTLVFDKATGQLVLNTGSSGGALIIHYTAKTLYGVLNWGLNAQQALNLPNFASLNGPSILEDKRFPASTVEALRARGARVLEQAMTSGSQAIQKTPDGFFGGADPRREGIVLGD